MNNASCIKGILKDGGWKWDDEFGEEDDLNFINMHRSTEGMGISRLFHGFSIGILVRTEPSKNLVRVRVYESDCLNGYEFTISEYDFNGDKDGIRFLSELIYYFSYEKKCRFYRDIFVITLASARRKRLELLENKDGECDRMAEMDRKIHDMEMKIKGIEERIGSFDGK